MASEIFTAEELLPDQPKCSRIQTESRSIDFKDGVVRRSGGPQRRVRRAFGRPAESVSPWTSPVSWHALL